MVFEGSLHGRSVAVKRMLRHLYHLAKKEIDALILSDEVGRSCCCNASLQCLAVADSSMQSALAKSDTTDASAQAIFCTQHTSKLHIG